MNLFENISEIIGVTDISAIETGINYFFNLGGFTILAIWFLDTSFGVKSPRLKK